MGIISHDLLFFRGTTTGEESRDIIPMRLWQDLDTLTDINRYGTTSRQSPCILLVPVDNGGKNKLLADMT